MKLKTCKRCGKVFYVKCGGNEFKKRIFCSSDCANKANGLRNSQSKMGKKNPMFGKHSVNYKGGCITLSGSRNKKYRLIWISGKGYVREHTYLIEKHLNRKLKGNEVVHHKDGNGLNNSLNNLEVMTKSEHSKLHNKKK